MLRDTWVIYGCLILSSSLCHSGIERYWCVAFLRLVLLSNRLLVPLPLETFRAFVAFIASDASWTYRNDSTTGGRQFTLAASTWTYAEFAASTPLRATSNTPCGPLRTTLLAGDRNFQRRRRFRHINGSGKKGYKNRGYGLYEWSGG